MEDQFHLWLAALGGDVPAGEMRIRWNVKDDPTPVLDAQLRDAAYLYVGSWSSAHDSEQPQSGRCPACRVFDWLFWRGTSDGYVVPMLDDRLLGELLRCLEPRPTDLPAPAADQNDVRDFLIAHSGYGLLPKSHGPEGR